VREAAVRENIMPYCGSIMNEERVKTGFGTLHHHGNRGIVLHAML
jgi:hypothetical protein